MASWYGLARILWTWLRRADPKIKDHYRLLGVLPSATPKQIQHAYWDKARTLHPDVNPDPNALADFQALVEAYDTLKNPVSRREYDSNVISAYCLAAVTGRSRPLEITSEGVDENPRPRPFVATNVLKQ